ncbi:MAG: hypothetical protein SFX72_20025 [Isosphaeraceae bacterium]|nr:hypothetical protein [Isosphaeraceae bacterium]
MPRSVLETRPHLAILLTTVFVVLAIPGGRARASVTASDDDHAARCCCGDACDRRNCCCASDSSSEQQATESETPPATPDGPLPPCMKRGGCSGTDAPFDSARPDRSSKSAAIPQGPSDRPPSSSRRLAPIAASVRPIDRSRRLDRPPDAVDARAR